MKLGKRLPRRQERLDTAIGSLIPNSVGGDTKHAMLVVEARRVPLVVAGLVPFDPGWFTGTALSNTVQTLTGSLIAGQAGDTLVWFFAHPSSPHPAPGAPTIHQYDSGSISVPEQSDLAVTAVNNSTGILYVGVVERIPDLVTLQAVWPATHGGVGYGVGAFPTGTYTEIYDETVPTNGVLPDPIDVSGKYIAGCLFAADYDGTQTVTPDDPSDFHATATLSIPNQYGPNDDSVMFFGHTPSSGFYAANSIVDPSHLRRFVLFGT